MCSGKGRQGITPARFPHSDIPGSKPACDSPRLFAACHVLHRLLVPRHPPHALTSLAKKFAPDRHIRCITKPDPCDKKGSINAQQKICWTIQFSKNRLASAKLADRTSSAWSASFSESSGYPPSAGHPLLDDPSAAKWWRIPGSNR